MAMTLAKIAEHVDALKVALSEWPTLAPLINKMLLPDRRASINRKTPPRVKRTMTAAQLKANSIRMKKRWAAVKKAGRTTL